MKTEKYLDENGISTLDKSKAKFIKIISFDDETNEPIRSWTIKIDKNKIQKARVYVKNPSDAPQGVKVFEGPQRGHYYESSESSQQQETKPQESNIEIITGEIKDNHILDSLETFSEEGNIEAIEPPSQEVVNNWIKKSGVKDRKIIVIPYWAETVNAFNYLGEDTIYLMGDTEEVDKEVLAETTTELFKYGYNIKPMTWEARRIGTIVHEEFHIRTYKLCGITSTTENWVGKLHFKFGEYEKYVLKYLKSDDKTIDGETLLELLAEDGRINNRYGNEFPHRYFYAEDKKDENFKEQRAFRLRQIGLV